MVRGTIKITGNKSSGIENGANNVARNGEQFAGSVLIENDSDSRTGREPVVETGNDAESESEYEFETVAGEPLRIDPATLRGNETGNVSNISDGRKTRKARGLGRPKKTTFAQSSNLEKVLLSLHIMGAAITKTPELIIDAEEAKILSSAILEVNAAYDIPIVSPKTMAVIGLCTALGTLYGPRIVAIANNRPKKPVVVINKPKDVYQSPVNGVNIPNPVPN